MKFVLIIVYFVFTQAWASSTTGRDSRLAECEIKKPSFSLSLNKRAVGSPIIDGTQEKVVIRASEIKGKVKISNGSNIDFLTASGNVNIDAVNLYFATLESSKDIGGTGISIKRNCPSLGNFAVNFSDITGDFDAEGCGFILLSDLSGHIRLRGSFEIDSSDAHANSFNLSPMVINGNLSEGIKINSESLLCNNPTIEGGLRITGATIKDGGTYKAYHNAYNDSVNHSELKNAMFTGSNSFSGSYRITANVNDVTINGGVDCSLADSPDKCGRLEIYDDAKIGNGASIKGVALIWGTLGSNTIIESILDQNPVSSLFSGISIDATSSFKGSGKKLLGTVSLTTMAVVENSDITGSPQGTTRHGVQVSNTNVKNATVSSQGYIVGGKIDGTTVNGINFNFQQAFLTEGSVTGKAYICGTYPAGTNFVADPELGAVFCEAGNLENLFGNNRRKSK